LPNETEFCGFFALVLKISYLRHNYKYRKILFHKYKEKKTGFYKFWLAELRNPNWSFIEEWSRLGIAHRFDFSLHQHDCVDL